MGQRDFPQRNAPHDDGQRLHTSVPALGCNNRHKGRGNGNLLNRSFKKGNDQSTQRGGHQIERQPGQTKTDRLPGRVQHFFLFIQTGKLINVFRRLLLHDIHHVIDRNTAEQAALAIDYGQRNQVIFFKHLGDLFLVQVRSNRNDLLVHNGFDEIRRAGEDELPEGEDADEAIGVIDDKDAVDIRDFIALTANHLSGLVDTRALGHDHILDLHDSAGRILGITQELADFIGHVLRHFVEDRLGAPRRQGGQQVGGIIRVKIFDQISQPVIRQALNEVVFGVGGNKA